MTVEFETPSADRVHLFRFRARPTIRDHSLLAADEVERARRYRFAPDRDRFVAARTRLRRILGAYTGERPEEIRFRYGRFGKPSLERPLFFNLSHSGDFCAVAVARFEVGLDIEVVRSFPEGVAEGAFAPDEVARLRRLPKHQQTQAFFACWTRKEAYVKARGDGLHAPLDRFSVSFEPLEQARILSVSGDPSEPARWRMRHLDPFPGVCGALAARHGFTHVLDMSRGLRRFGPDAAPLHDRSSPP